MELLQTLFPSSNYLKDVKTQRLSCVHTMNVSRNKEYISYNQNQPGHIISVIFPFSCMISFIHETNGLQRQLLLSILETFIPTSLNIKKNRIHENVCQCFPFWSKRPIITIAKVQYLKFYTLESSGVKGLAIFIFQWSNSANIHVTPTLRRALCLAMGTQCG